MAHVEGLGQFSHQSIKEFRTRGSRGPFGDGAQGLLDRILTIYYLECEVILRGEHFTDRLRSRLIYMEILIQTTSVSDILAKKAHEMVTIFIMVTIT